MRSIPGRSSAALMTCALAVVASGCSALAPPDDPQQTVLVTATVTTVTPEPGLHGGVGDSETAQTAIPTEFNLAPTGAHLGAVIGGVSGPVGIAVTAVGGREQVDMAGDWQSGVAWSTIKVPLAVAVARASPPSLEAASTAITASDNEAAERLWDSLGGGAASADAVSAVLADGGDATTQIPVARTRPEYSIFGQTQWALSDQARFGSQVPCIESSSRVLDLMGQVAPDQRWGLGRIPGARFKGGWGPGVSGGYLVRQFGTVPAAGGEAAVAIAVESPSFEVGVASLSSIADALAPQLAGISGGRC